MTENLSPEQFLTRTLKGDGEAVTFVLHLCKVLHLWDDLEDRDKPILRADVDKAMYLALVAIPRNAFYRKYFDELNAVLANAIYNWHCANDLESKDTQAGREVAFVIRSSYCDVVLTAARIIGGYDWARLVAPEIRSYWHSEGFTGYQENLDKQRRLAKELEREHILQ